MTARSLHQIIPYDAYSKAEAFLTQPLQIVAGSEAGSKWMSDDLLARAASKDKTLWSCPKLVHDLLHEPEGAAMIDGVARWLRCAGCGPSC